MIYQISASCATLFHQCMRHLKGLVLCFLLYQKQCLNVMQLRCVADGVALLSATLKWHYSNPTHCMTVKHVLFVLCFTVLVCVLCFTVLVCVLG